MKNFRLEQLLFFVLASICNSSELIAAELTADQIVQKASLASYYGGEDGRSLARMKIVDANGRKQTRQFTIIRKDNIDGGNQKFLVVFSRPSDVKGTVFMVHKNVGGEDDRWLYLPALDLVKRISAGDKRTSFVGAHYFYEDVSGRSPLEDKHELVSSEGEYYTLEHTPKDKTSVEFESYKTQIDKKTFLPMIIEYYDSDNKLIRKIETLSVESIQSIPTVTKAKVSNLLDGSYTLMEFKRMKYDMGIPDEVFSERSLRNPPVKWLKKK